MRFRSHINLSAGLLGAIVYSLGASRIASLSLPFSDIPFSMLFILLGTGLVDIDTKWKGPGHRVNSPLHKLEAPWMAGAVFLTLFLVSPRVGILSSLPAQLTIGALLLVCIGWFFHLIGDFIEGGVGSYLFRGKRGRVGFTWFTWARYDGTFLGNFVDISILAGVAVSVFFLSSALPDARCELIPKILNKAFGLDIPLGAGRLTPALLWIICMAWGRGGYKGFAARVGLTVLGGLVAFLVYANGIHVGWR